MFRLLVIIATLAFAAPDTSVDAQGRTRCWNRGGHYAGSRYSHSRYNSYRSYGGVGAGGYGGLGYGGYRGYRSSAPLTLFGLSFGLGNSSPYGYGYDYAGYPDPYFTYPYMLDPWSRGSFRAPDLLDDPYFYDRVPSANRYRTPSVVRAPAPSTTYRSTSKFNTVVDENVGFEVEQYDAPADTLQSACDRLLLSLASYGGGDAWIEYLAPDRIVELVQEGNVTELSELLARYDSVSRNHQLNVVAAISGFDATRSRLRQALSQPMKANVQPIEEESFESLPAPKPEPTLESPKNDATEV